MLEMYMNDSIAETVKQKCRGGSRYLSDDCCDCRTADSHGRAAEQASYRCYGSKRKCLLLHCIFHQEISEEETDAGQMD